MFKNFLMDETGAELAEYCVAIALLVAVALVIYQVLGQGLSDANSATAQEIQDASITVNP
jgi:Flp pilus assembly pilin Flp